MDGELNRYAILEKAIRISNSIVDVERRLRNLLELFLREMGLDQAYLFNLDRDAGQLILRMSGRTASVPDVQVGLEGHILARTVAHRQSKVVGPEEMEGLPDTCLALFQDHRTLATFPIQDDQVLYGVLVLASLEPVSYRLDRITLIETIALEMAGTIRNSRLYLESKKRISDLSVLYEVGRSVSSTLDLNKVLDTVVTMTCTVLMGQGSALNVMDNRTNRLVVAASSGIVPDGCQFRRLLDDPERPMPDEVLACVRRNRPYVGMAREDPECPAMRRSGGEKSVVCVPLRFKGAYSGTLSVYNKVAAPPGRAREFNREDMELMGTMAALIAASLENALTFQTATLLAEHNELLVHSLTSLYEISSALMTTVRMDELLAIITRALTYERGFGFDRAMILAMNEDEDTLEGAVYREVIPEDRLENGPSLSEALREAGEISPFVRDSSLFSSYRLPVTLTDHVLVRTALEKRSFTVLPGDPEHSFDPPSPVPFGAHEFATLPLLAKGKVVGVLAVDRDHRRLALDPADHQNLSMLANQAGLAIENSRLYEYIEKAKEQLSVARGRLIEAEKLAALGELAAGMAHEIRNPLVTIGGFTRRMLKGLPEDAPQRAYVEVVITQVNRLEKILGEVLDFSGSQVSHLAEHNLNDLVADALYIFRREMDQGAIEICREFGPTPTVHVDDGQIKQVFFNLFYNAIQAMTRGGGLRVRTFATRIGDREFAACEVSDTGPGIPNDILPQIFNPFFTTKDDGTGLGLSIVHKIVTRHHGEIDVVNLEGQGASFTIKLPAAAQAGLYLK